MILSTHIVSDVEAVATSIAIMDRGRLLAWAEPEALLSAVEGRVWEWVIPSADLSAARGRWKISSTARRADGVHVCAWWQTCPPPRRRPAQPSLEDAYLAVLEGDRARAEVA